YRNGILGLDGLEYAQSAGKGVGGKAVNGAGREKETEGEKQNKEREISVRKEDEGGRGAGGKGENSGAEKEKDEIKGGSEKGGGSPYGAGDAGGVLVVAKGVGVAAAAPVLTWLRDRGLRASLLVDTEKISEALVRDYLLDAGPGPAAPAAAIPSPVRYLHLKDPADLNELRQTLTQKPYRFVCVLASDYYVKTIGDMVRELQPEAGLAYSNNFRLCCGEGVCGACCTETAGGELLRMCKCQKSSFA
ncbi:MAG: hypothetical protein Q4C22_01665, partial [Bacillota bacterium]|nr:hypothetical protein [Bacillota bacterium]